MRRLGGKGEETRESVESRAGKSWELQPASGREPETAAGVAAGPVPDHGPNHGSNLATGQGLGAEERNAGSAAGNLPKIIPFSSLVRCGDEVWIEHAGNLYRLRRTKQDKLILTK